MKKIKQIKQIMMIMVGVVFLAGCNGLTSSQEPTSLYNLRYVGGETAIQTPQAVMMIGAPVVPAGMETDRIALYLDDGRRMDYYAGSAWVDSLDDVLQDVIIKAGRDALPDMVVDSPRLNVPVNYRLAVKFLEFAPVYTGGADSVPTLKVAVNFTLIHMPARDVVADFAFESSQPAIANDMRAVTGGLESRLQAILSEGFVDIAAAINNFERGAGK